MVLKIELAMIVFCNIKIISTKMTGHIINGSASKITDFPHSAFLVISCYSDLGEGNFLCGASIVNQVILLTAGHCCKSCKEHVDAYAAYGHKQIDKASTAKVLGFKIHDDYSEAFLSNDIALVLLKKRVKLSKEVRRVGLLKVPPLYEGEATVAGWGKVNAQSNDVSDVLMSTRQLILPLLTCRFILDNPDGTFCAESRPGMGYPSRGDSGSALVVSKFIQIGLVSYIDPSLSTRNTVYTDISYFYDWIQTNAKELNCKQRSRVIHTSDQIIDHERPIREAVEPLIPAAMIAVVKAS